METLAPLVVTAMIGMASMVLSYLGHRNKARVDEVADLRAQVRDLVVQLEAVKVRLMECEEGRQAQEAEIVRLMRLLVK